MGKYMRRCGRGVGEVAVMEVTQVVGVRTRARALALAAASAAADAEAPPHSAAGAKRRRVEGGGELCVSYLQLRSRSLILTPAKTRRAASAAAAHSPRTSVPLGRAAGGGECDRVSRCSSNTSGGELAASVAPASKMTGSRSGRFLAPEVDDGSETTACNYDGDHQGWREQTPLSEAGERETDDLESTARPSASGGPRRQDAASAPAGTEFRMPSEAEIAEFFAAAEEPEQKRFADKYNYDVVKDVPLQGRYDWMQIKP